MSVRHVLTVVFLWLGVVLVLISCLGVLVMRDAYARLHFASPALLGVVCIAVAVLINASFSLVGDKTILIAVFLLFVSPLLTHATGRACRVDRLGHWPLTGEEPVDVEEP